MQRTAAAGNADSGAVNTRRATFAALCATLVGIGLSRFAYTPLIPALIDAGWFTPGQAAYLGAANLVGYLAGALMARPLAAGAGAPAVLRGMMLLASLAFIACATPLSFGWFFVWRLGAGVAGGALMVLAAATVLPHVPSRRQGLAGGVIFTGVGLGIAASGTLVPALLRLGLVETWCGLGLLSLLLTGLAWSGWPPRRAAPTATPRPARRPSGPALRGLYLEYGLNAAGLVPHMVFLVDYVARGLDRGLVAGSGYWVLFGIGAMAGPVLAGQVADRIGFRATLRLAFLVQAVGIGWLAVSDATTGLVVSSLVVGAFVPGVVPLVLGRVRQLTAPDRDRQQAAWSLATTAFAVGQASAAYALSYLFAAGGGYDMLFAIGATALLLALLIDLAAARTADARTRGETCGPA